MKNVYDIKYEKGLDFILPLYQKLETDVNYLENSKILIVMHLHYSDTVKDYLKFIDEIPGNIDLIFTVANEQVKKKLRDTEFYNKKRHKIIEKENRGRDISAFLVACRKEILKYDYFCFLHDKKEKSVESKDDIRKWALGLWNNMIGSKTYINNVLSVFYRNPKLGLLVPPFPISNCVAHFFADTWGEDFSLVEDLAEKMNLNCDLDDKKQPITLGTVFWTKVPALKKLLEIEWKYDDFDEEPLKNDGTLSHAIERVLAYVAQDAGFETGWVMTDRYAGEEIEYMQMVLRKAFERLNKSLDIRNILELEKYEERTKKFIPFIHKYKKIYIYGAGIRGERYYSYLEKMKRQPTAFIVSDKGEEEKAIHDIPVYNISEVELDENCGIIIGVSEKYQQEILLNIKNKNQFFNNIFIS